MVSTIRPTHRAPYSRLEPVLQTFKEIRGRSLPDQITSATLEKWDIASSNAYQVMQVLKFLKLVDEDGHPTDKLHELHRAEDYEATLASILRDAYDFIFEYYEPTKDGPERVSSAFLHVEPRGQKSRMEWLFVGLLREAGILPKVDKPRRVQQNGKKPQNHAKRVKAAQPAEMPTQQLDPGMVPEAPVAPTTQPHTDNTATLPWPNWPTAQLNLVDYGILRSLLAQLPTNGKWTTVRRKKWLDAMAANLDLLIEVTDPE